jgi:hypothetical protein
MCRDLGDRHFTEDGGPYSEGFVHSNENGMEEALGVERGLFARRRIDVSAPLDDFFFSPDYRELIGANREGETGVVVNLDVGREIATPAAAGHAASRLGHQLDARRAPGRGHPASERGPDQRDRHGGLVAWSR